MEIYESPIENPEQMEEPTYIIKSPQECSAEELANFERLVLEAKQVNPEGITQKIQECLVLAFCYVGDDLAAIRGIKRKPIEQIEGIFKKAGVENDSQLPELEIGYAYTKPEYRGKDYSSTLLDQLMDKVGTDYIFATTGNELVIEYLNRRGFKVIGNPYPGVYNKLIYLMVRNKPLDK